MFNWLLFWPIFVLIGASSYSMFSAMPCIVDHTEGLTINGITYYKFTEILSVCTMRVAELMQSVAAS